MKDSICAVIQAQVTQPSTRANLVAQAQQIEENETLQTHPTFNNYNNPGHSSNFDCSSGPGPQRSQGRNLKYRHNPLQKQDDKNGKP